MARAPKTNTGNMTQARKFADIAFEEKRLTNIDVLVSKLGSIAACKTVAVGIQRSFCSMRVQERNKVARKLTTASQDALDTLARCKYDNIACRSFALPEGRGYRVVFEPANNVMDLLEVTFEDGTIPKQLDARIDKLTARMTHEIADIPVEQLFWYAQETGELDDAFASVVQYQCTRQGQLKWFEGVFKPAFDAQVTGTAKPQPAAPVVQRGQVRPTDKTAIDEQLDALGDDMFGEL